MIAAWASLTTGWALTHAWSVTAILTALLVLGVIFIVIPLTREPTGKRHASRPATPRAGKARAWLRKAPRAVRGLPGAIGWAWRTPVRTTASLPGSSPAASGAPGLSAAGGVPRSVRPGIIRLLGVPYRARVDAEDVHQESRGPRSLEHETSEPGVMGTGTAGVAGGQGSLAAATELHHEPTERAMLGWLRTLRGPGWTILALRRQLAVLGALTSGRVTPGHTAASPHGEPRHPAGDQAPTRGDAQGRAVRVCARGAEGASVTPGPESRPAPGADMTGSLSPHATERPGLVSAPPDPGAGPGQPDSQIENVGQRAGLAGRELRPLPHVAGPGTRLIPAADRDTATAQALAAVGQRAAELAEIHDMPTADYLAGLADYAPEPWPLDKLASDTWVGGMAAIRDEVSA